jgi:PAS domain S-box-containing protein
MSTHGHHIVDALGTVGAPILMFDKRGFVVWTNMAARRLLGDESGELTGQSFVRFVAPECRSAMGEALVELVRGDNESTELSIVVTGLDGHRVSLDLRAATVRVDGFVAGVIAVVADAVPSRPSELVGV